MKHLILTLSHLLIITSAFAGFSLKPLPLKYDCAYLSLQMALDASSFDCDSGSTCSITMTVRVSFHDSALNEFYAYPFTFSNPCDVSPTETLSFTWPPGWFVYNGLVPGDTYWVQLEMLSFTTQTSATETYLLGNNLKITLEGPATYSQTALLTKHSFVYSPMEADFISKEIKPSGLKVKTNTNIQLESTSTIYGDVDYRWYLDGSLIGTDSIITYSPPCQEHEIKLEIEQVPGGCITETKQILSASSGCVSPLRKSKEPFLPSVIEQGSRLEFPEVFGRRYELMDMAGRSLSLDTRWLPAGIYYLRVMDNGDFWIHRFLVR